MQVREEHFPGVRLCVRSESTRMGCRTTQWVRSLALRARNGREAASWGEERWPVTGRTGIDLTISVLRPGKGRS